MNRLAVLLGSATRANIVEALALSGRPMTAYRIAKTYNMNVAKVYLEVKKLEGIGAVGSAGKVRGKEYLLTDRDLKRLAQRLSSRVQTYEGWSSDEAKRDRFKMGLLEVPQYSMEMREGPVEVGERRMPGELENLATLGRRKFDRKYRRTEGREYDRV